MLRMRVHSLQTSFNHFGGDSDFPIASLGISLIRSTQSTQYAKSARYNSVVAPHSMQHVMFSMVGSISLFLACRRSQERQLIERFLEILYQRRRGSTALEFGLRPGMPYSSGLDFQEAFIARA